MRRNLTKSKRKKNDTIIIITFINLFIIVFIFVSCLLVLCSLCACVARTSAPVGVPAHVLDLCPRVGAVCPGSASGSCKGLGAVGHWALGMRDASR